jgi:hypothetical protein
MMFSFLGRLLRETSKWTVAQQGSIAPGKRWPIIVGGFYRSGTTLLRRLLDSHPNVHCPPEIKFFKDFYGDYLDDPLGHIRFFSTVQSCGINRDKILAIFGGAYVDVREAASKKAGKQRWADKNPENSKFIYSWDKLLGGELFYLHVLRNPCDIICSLRESKFVKAVPQDLDGQLAMLDQYRSKALSYVGANRGKCFVIEYERLVRDPEGVLMPMFSFIGEDFDPRIMRELNSKKRGRGIEDPKIDASDRIHSNSVNRFQSELTKDEIGRIQKKTGQIYARFRDMVSSAG